MKENIKDNHLIQNQQENTNIMKIIIVGANDYQKALFEPLKNVIDIEVVFVDSIVKIEPNKLWGKKADTFIIDDILDKNEIGRVNDTRFIPNKPREVIKKQITYGP